MADLAKNLISFVIFLPPLILIHELGHFIAARLIGVTVLEFGIGFPPRAIKLFEHQGTEFTLNWLPIGGFVRPLGEDFVRPVGDNATEEERAAFEARQAERNTLEQRNIKTKSVMEAGPWQRIFFMIAGVVMNLITGVALFALAGLIGVPIVKSATIEVRGIAAGSPAEIAGLHSGDVITAAAGLPLALSGDAYQAFANNTGKAIPLTVKRGDQTLTLMITPSSTASADVGGVFVADVTPDSPAAKVGLQDGDRIVQMDDKPMLANKDLYDFGAAHLGKTVAMIIERDGQQQTLTITLNQQTPALGVAPYNPLATNAPTGLELLDLKLYAPVTSQPLGVAISDGISQSWRIIISTLSLPIDLIRGKISLQQARPVSIIGITQMATQVTQRAVDQGAAYPILNFAALISVAIGVTQLLPIPGLDGGRILFVLIELLRGKPISQEREGMVHLVGLMLLLGFMLIIVVNDLVNPISLK